MTDTPSFSPDTATLDEIRGLLRHFPGPDLEAATKVVERDRQLTKPPRSLGRLEQLAEWLATWQGRHPPRVEHPRVAVFAGNHGVAARGVSAFPPSVTEQMVANFVAGGAAVNQLARIADADLRVYEMGLEEPTADFTQGPAMTDDEAARAVAYGMMAVEAGLDVIALGEMGIANSTSAAALACALFGGEPRDWTGTGTGVAGEAFERKVETVGLGVALHRELTDPFDKLAALGGVELAAIVGAIMAARLARTPVLLDGFACTVAASVLWKADPKALDHCVVAHRSREPGHTRLMTAIGNEPLLDLDMALGEASGAAIGIQILRAAAACHAGMATFADAGVDGGA